jgi:hypothetical protein
VRCFGSGLVASWVPGGNAAIPRTIDCECAFEDIETAEDSATWDDGDYEVYPHPDYEEKEQ